MSDYPSGSRVFVALGSNLGQPHEQIAAAIKVLQQHPHIQWLEQSAHYLTPPWGDTDQPAFINAVVELATTLDPASLMSELLAIEQRAGRVRERHWGPRVLDLDLLAYGQCVFITPHLILPHPGIAERSFVLVPWAEIAADFSVPGLGRVRDLLAKCPGVNAVERLT